MHRGSHILLSLLAAGALACGTHHPHEETQASLLVTTPLRKSVELKREYVAQIRAHQHIELRALERGYLQSSFVKEGQQVTSGQRMFQILPLLYNAEVQKAHAESERAGIEYANTKSLAEKNVVSPQELALSKADLDKAKAQLQLAKIHKGLTTVQAPFTGVMGRLLARQGSLIDEGDLLTTLSDNRTMWVYFNVAEREYLDLKAESPDLKSREVRLVMANDALFETAGRIDAIDGDFDNETGTIAFRASFSNPDGLLRHGETGKVVLTRTVPEALVIPQKATFDVLDRKFVFVVDEHHVVHSRPITVSAELPQLFVISGGLSESEHILLDGLRKVHDGSEIQPEFQAPVEVLKTLEVTAG